MIYLASTSPRRRMLLRKAGIPLRILKPDYEEDHGLKVKPSQLVQIHAIKKAESCADKIKDGVILAADTLVYLKGKVIGKPKNKREAEIILQRLQGRWHAVYTGVAILKLVSSQIVKKTIFFEKTKVRLKRLTGFQIKNYFKRVNPLDKAGAYAIQSSHGGIVEEIKGLASNAIGLPIEKILQRIN